MRNKARDPRQRAVSDFLRDRSALRRYITWLATARGPVAGAAIEARLL
ncbi:hypothetical protein [Streptomyces luteolus]|uniref:Uncharacterized protein n=1 Tax=Streptomyces luteolus TaxID=3043615 RepID=A0ABT6T3W1_9ACTN|nr:hypothetical protein [Streptomyces sp. B-S-A12]MDI3422557.1 hypothetical protein [Streptomyces sp. B-S-A12]